MTEKTVEDIAMEIMVKTQKWMAQDYDFSIKDAMRIIQQFLDAQISERDKIVRKECADIAEDKYRRDCNNGCGEFNDTPCGYVEHGKSCSHIKMLRDAIEKRVTP